MKRLVIVISLVPLFSSLALAQNFSGTYVLESGEGGTVLSVQQDPQGKVRGTLQFDDGPGYQLEGMIKNNEAVGIASLQGKSSLFKLRFQGDQLMYTIIPVTADNKPDVKNAQEFPFIRHGDVPATAGGEFPTAGNPLAPAAPGGGAANPLAEGGTAPDPFVGTFADDRLTLRLSGGGGNYTGQMQFQGQTFPVSARSPDGRSLRGTFSSGGDSFQFDAMLQGPALALTTSGTTYNLRRIGGQQAAPGLPANPLGGQGRAPAAAQGPGGAINDPYMGVSFDPPQGWKYEKRQAIYVIGHMTIPGMILVMPHSYNSAQEVMAAANEPLYQGQDGQLMLTRAPQVVSQNMLVSDFGGVLGGQQAQGRIICMISPHGGGVLILAGTAAGSYTQQYATLAEGMARSMRFSKPQEPPGAAMWKQRLAGARLAYMKSGGSTDSSGGYAWSDQHDIYLCSDGSFQSSGGFSGTLGTAGGSAIWDPGNQTKVGQWAIVGHGGVPALQLRHQDGDVQTWALSTDGQKTLLDGVQYFVVENP
ncbi:MAG: hypothetical protein HYS61_03580, partial [Acidobacteria bacterium]|nr:hypothetical protein [Acidobacteriota bacterium]